MRRILSDEIDSDVGVETLFERANKQWENGALRSAFRLFLAAAKAGDTSSQVNLGYFYSEGIGVKRNRAHSLYWNRRAYRRHEGCAATNIAVLFRDEGNVLQALAWFERAVALGDNDARVEAAKLYLLKGKQPEAVRHLSLATMAGRNDITGAGLEEAQEILRRLGQK